MIPTLFIRNPFYMKYPYYLLFSLIFIFQACSPDDTSMDGDTSEYYFRYKVDGKQIDYPFKPETQINLSGIYESNGQLYAIQVFGAADILDSGQNNQLVLHIGDSTEITTNITYTNIEAPDSTVPGSNFSMGYTDMDKIVFITSKNVISTQLYKNARIRFEKISENNIKGIFSGTLSYYDMSTGKPVLAKEVVITDGEFNVPRY